MIEAWTTNIQHWEISKYVFCCVFKLILLFICLFKSAISQCKECAKIWTVMIDNCLKLRTSQKSLAKGAWAFLFAVTASAVADPGV